MDYNTNCGIYKITNLINGKFYIGSSKVINQRWAAHRWELKYNRHHNQRLQNAYNKYGLENFAYEILEYVEEDKLIEREQHYIDTLNSCNRNVGYNLNTFAQGGGGAVGEKNGWYGKGYLREGLLNHFYGKTHSEKTKELLSIYGSKRKGNLNPNFGNRGKKNPLSKQIAQIDPITHKVIKIWGASIDIKRELGIHSGNICQLCILIEKENVWKVNHGYYWCYEKDIKKANEMKHHTHAQKKTVIKLDKNTKAFLSEYESVSEAAKEIGIGAENISRVCKGKNQTAGGFKWMYKEEYEKTKSAN